MVQFDKYTGTTINGSVPIVTTEAKWTSNGQDCKRVQFPLLLAFAVTIYKAQGLTLDSVVVDIGDTEKSLGLTYVALSRVKTFEGLALNRPYDFTRFSSIATHRHLLMRKQEETRLLTIAL